MSRPRPAVRLAVRLRPEPGSVPWLVEVARAAAGSGADAVLVAPSAGVDPYVVLGAIAAATDEIALGALAEPTGRRPASVLAKLVSTLDVVSSGRAMLGLAAPAGATSSEHAVDALADALEICRAMHRLPHPSMAGRIEQITDAWNEPRVRGADPPPIAVLVAGSTVAPRSSAGLRLAARFADYCVHDAGKGAPGAALVAVRGELDRAGLDAGRRPGELRLLSLVEATTGAARHGGSRELAREVAASRAAGFDGVVADVSVGSGPLPALDDLLRELARAWR